MVKASSLVPDLMSRKVTCLNESWLRLRKTLILSDICPVSSVKLTWDGGTSTVRTRNTSTEKETIFSSPTTSVPASRCRPTSRCCPTSKCCPTSSPHSTTNLYDKSPSSDHLGDPLMLCGNAGGSKTYPLKVKVTPRK